MKLTKSLPIIKERNCNASLVLDTRTNRKNVSEYPLAIRFTVDRKFFYHQVGVSYSEKHFSGICTATKSSLENYKEQKMWREENVRLVLLHHRHLRGVRGHSYADSTTLWDVIKLNPLSQIAMVVLFFVKYLPMTAVTTTNITDMWHICDVALDSSQPLFTHLGQFFCSNLRILSNLIFYPFVKFVSLSATLSAILSATLSIVFGITL